MKPDAVTSSYKRWAPIYDAVFNLPMKEGRKRASSTASALGGKVLEVGVGTGLALPFYSSDVEIMGIDYSQAMLDKADERVRKLGLENVSLRQMDARVLDFPDDSFDTICAMHVLSVVPEPEKVMAEMTRVCRPGGHLIVVNHFSSKGGALGFVERLMAPLQDKLGWQADFPINRVLNQDGLKELDRRRLPPLGMMTWLLLQKL